MAPRAQRLAASITVAGFASCGFHRRALEVARQALKRGYIGNLNESLTFDDREAYQNWLQDSDTRGRFVGSRRALKHTSSPFVYIDDCTFLGGCEDLVGWLEGKPLDTSKSLTPPADFPGKFGIALRYDGSRDVGNGSFRQKLSATQYMILRQGATEERGVGKSKGGFDDVFDASSYYECAACALPLYTSGMKFDCGCGWPGYFKCIGDAVFARPDKDNVRTEIVCNGCGGHLGHVYANEGFHGMVCSKSGNVVDTDHRHCVNSGALTLRLADGSLRPCTFKGRVFLESLRTKEDPTASTTLLVPWSEDAGGRIVE